MTRTDVTKLRQWFTTFCAGFTCSADEEARRNFLLKEDHTFKVVTAISAIAAAEGCSGDDLLLAETIGLLHDVGRFPQYRQFRTFKDADSLNHATQSVRTIIGERILDNLPPEERRLILTCVALHNVYETPDTLDDRTLFFLRLIRDADKLDIWRVFLEYYGHSDAERASAVGLGFPDHPGYSANVLDALASGEMVNLVNVKNLNDFKLLQLSWIYDLNFVATLRLFQERRYLETFTATLPSHDDIVNALARLSSHIQQRIDAAHPTESGEPAWTR